MAHAGSNPVTPTTPGLFGKDLVKAEAYKSPRVRLPHNPPNIAAPAGRTSPSEGDYEGSTPSAAAIILHLTGQTRTERSCGSRAVTETDFTSSFCVISFGESVWDRLSTCNADGRDRYPNSPPRFNGPYRCLIGRVRSPHIPPLRGVSGSAAGQRRVRFPQGPDL